jgi:hypothetical protein
MHVLFSYDIYVHYSTIYHLLIFDQFCYTSNLFEKREENGGGQKKQFVAATQKKERKNDLFSKR